MEDIRSTEKEKTISQLRIERDRSSGFEDPFIPRLSHLQSPLQCQSKDLIKSHKRSETKELQKEGKNMSVNPQKGDGTLRVGSSTKGEYSGAMILTQVRKTNRLLFWMMSIGGIIFAMMLITIGKFIPFPLWGSEILETWLPDGRHYLMIISPGWTTCQPTMNGPIFPCRRE